VAVTKAKPKKITGLDVGTQKRRGHNPDPKWLDWEKMTGAEYHRYRRNAVAYYYAEYKTADLLPDLYAWMKENQYSAADIKNVKAMGSHNLTHAAIAARCLRTGMPDFNKTEAVYWEALEGTMGEMYPVSKWLKEQIDVANKAGAKIVQPEAVVDNKPAAYQPSIQERLRETAMAMTDELEDAHELFLKDPEGFNKTFKVLNLLKGKDAKGAHARIIAGFYQGPYEEIVEVMGGKDAQLNEGYSCYSKKQIKKLHDFYKEILDACTMLQEEGKVNRKPRLKKAPSKDKLAAKVKYLKTNEPLKLVSVNPADIIGAKELWVFNIKTRKIGKYVAAEYHDLGLKGTSITGFDENLSVQKTLRKPEDQLKEFKAAGKVQLRKFLDDIKAVDIKLSGRINEDTILLKTA
jgi:hypothetical protein